jgi:hypothetical protein
MNIVACPGAPFDFAASRARVIFGAVVMLVGVILLADQFDWWGIRVRVPLWPWLLILLGVGKLSGGRRHRINRTGWWLIAIGVWGLVTELRLFGVGFRRGWPLLVLIAGLFMIWRAIDPPVPPERRGGQS